MTGHLLFLMVIPVGHHMLFFNYEGRKDGQTRTRKYIISVFVIYIYVLCIATFFLSFFLSPPIFRSYFLPCSISFVISSPLLCSPPPSFPTPLHLLLYPHLPVISRLSSLLFHPLLRTRDSSSFASSSLLSFTFTYLHCQAFPPPFSSPST